MNITQLIIKSIEAEKSYQKAKTEYRADHYGEFDHHVKGLRMNGERLDANAELEAYIANNLSDNKN